MKTGVFTPKRFFSSKARPHFEVYGQRERMIPEAEKKISFLRKISNVLMKFFDKKASDQKMLQLLLFETIPKRNVSSTERPTGRSLIDICLNTP